MAFPTLAITVDWAADGSHASANDDITADVKVLTFSRSVSFSGSDDVGECTLTVNNIAGKYSPDNSAGVLFGNLKPGRKLWVRATYSAVTYALFYGTIRRITLFPESKTAEINCDDALYDLSKVETNVPLSTTRSIKTFRGLVLDDAGIVSGQRTLADGIESNIPTTWADQAQGLSMMESLNAGTGTLHFIKPSTTAGTFFAYKTIDRTALQAAAVAEAWGETLVTAVGGFDINDEAIVNSQRVIPTMLARDAEASSLWTGGPISLTASQTTNRWPTFSSQADGVAITYTATGTASASVIGYGDSCKVTLAGGASGGTLSDIEVTGYVYQPLDSEGVVVTDATSTTTYGARWGRPIVRPDPLRTDPIEQGEVVSSEWIESIAAAEGLATWIVQRYKDGPPRPTVTRTNDFPSVIAREVGDLITWTYPLLSLVSKRYYVRRIDTTIVAGEGTWDTTYVLEQALPDVLLFTVGGSAAQGVGGTGILAY